MKIAVLVCGLVLSLAAAPGLAQSTPETAATVRQGSDNVQVGGRGAARSGDAMGRNGSVTGGSSNVFINGKRAVRAGDSTDCGGVVIGGNANILVNGKPLAASGDPTTGCK